MEEVGELPEVTISLEQVADIVALDHGVDRYGDPGLDKKPDAPIAPGECVVAVLHPDRVVDVTSSVEGDLEEQALATGEGRDQCLVEMEGIGTDLQGHPRTAGIVFEHLTEVRQVVGLAAGDLALAEAEPIGVLDEGAHLLFGEGILALVNDGAHPAGEVAAAGDQDGGLPET